MYSLCLITCFYALARHFMKQIVEGLLYLQSHNILHRDLSLSNLLLTKDMNIVSSSIAT